MLPGEPSEDEPASAAPDDEPAPSRRVVLRPTRRLRLVVLAIVAIVALQAVVSDWDSPLRTVLVLGFVLFVPGLAISELLEIEDPIHRLAMATAAGLAVQTLVATFCVYSGVTSFEGAFVIVVAMTFLTIVVAAVRDGRGGARRPPDAKPRRAAT